ncbi:hypothetical protein OHB26_21215 [Nocardia sp. NBC_01503]|uniref:hypothetical protein n=1 Tax=Nocardia sp. NBC_01503 TaxID=2975997 RepID=UPI002E7C2581|nr:hypothetical protein [Nocardia sp. NBC_01503]WTL29514.1 hypothetical protein OHB26_21215 [Nocardia sp. NBC_01503]
MEVLDVEGVAEVTCSPIRRGARRQAAAIAGAEYLEFESGHVVMLEDPAPRYAAILDFLGKHPIARA